MRKFIILITIITILIIPIPLKSTAKADSNQYGRVTDDITPFFVDESATDLLFYLPYTYYVKVLSVDGLIAHIEFGDIAIDGYTFADKLFFDDQVVTSPYPTLTLKTHSATMLYSDGDLTSPVRYIFKDRSLNFYGNYKTEKGYSYLVEYNGDLGFVYEGDLYPFSVPNQENPLTFLPPEKTDEIGKISNSNPFRIIIISCLGLAGVIGLFIALKNKKSPTKIGDYYEERDFE